MSNKVLGSLGVKQDIQFRQGSTFGPYNMNILQADGTPLNLTGYTFSARIKKTPTSSTILAEFVITPVDLILGKLKISIPSTVTANIQGAGEDLAEYVWDMEYTDDVGITEPLFYGTVYVKSNV
jgi:hypothetical protein